MSASDIILKLSNIESYYGPIMAIRGISLEVPRGRIVTLLGANGAGKTTVLRTIAGVLPVPAPAVRFDGAPVGGRPAHELVGRGIVLVPEGRRIFPSLTVEENLLVGAYRGRPGRWTLARVYALFPVLAERRRQPGTNLSGGEQQMLAISRALMSRPSVLLLDEPSLGLAPQLVQTIFRVIRDINAEGTTILLVEQNAHMALVTAHRGYIMEVGRITHADETKALLASDRVRKAYLGG
jgi:branched-chain amino acid transport system ATP-binding protein